MVEENIVENKLNSPDVDSGCLRNDLSLFSDPKEHGDLKKWTIFDPVADAYYRINTIEHTIISFLGNNRKMSELIQIIADGAPWIKKIDIAKTLVFLNQNNLLMPVYKKTEQRIIRAKNARKKTILIQFLSSYLFFKLPLWKPDRFISKTYPFIRSILNHWTILFLFLISLTGYISVITHWHIFSEAIESSLNFNGLIRYGVTVIILKVFHEFAHAYTAKSEGIRVRRFGIGFIVFFPRLYTDLSDSWRIPSKYKRLLIDTAGIIIELIIGGFAALVWLNTGPGVTHTVAYYTLAVSIINTVLINGNPFIRYDGYYFLMDLVEIDNLQGQAFLVIKSMFRKFFFGINTGNVTTFKNRTKLLLIGYGISCFIYRIFLYTGIILIVYFKFTKSIGIILVILEIYLLILRPIITESRIIMKGKNKIQKKHFIPTLFGVLCIAGVLFVPLPWTLTMPCEVFSDPYNRIYIPNDGFLEKIYVKNEGEVIKNEVILSMKNPFLEMDIKRKKIKLVKLYTELDQARSSYSKIARANVIREQIKTLQNRISEARRKMALSKLKSPLSGIFIFHDRHIKASKWLYKGEIIGNVYSKNKKIRAYLKEDSINRIEKGNRVTVYINGELVSITGKVISINLTPVTVISPTPLLKIFGGNLETIKTSEGFKFTQPHYQIIIQPSKTLDLPSGRSASIHVRKYTSIGLKFIRNILKVVQKELSF